MTLVHGEPVAKKSATVVDGEYELTMRDFRRIAAMLKDDSGIALAENRTALVYSRLAKRLRALALRDFASYCDFVEAQPSREERGLMLSALTTNLTRFYREPHHFTDLETKLMPGLIDKARRGGRVRLWSAGCSTGAEAYSIGLTILKVFPDVANFDVRLLATDIDPEVLRKARAGIWSAEEISPVPNELRDKWCSRDADGDGWTAGPALRRLIAFNELNLNRSWPLKAKFDVIFCRNVAIYFDDVTQAALWDRLCDQLNPGGTLYIGHSERLQGSKASRMRGDGVTIYRAPAGAVS